MSEENDEMVPLVRHMSVNPQDEEIRRDNSRDPKFCIFFSAKCGVMFAGFYLGLNLLLACI